MIFLLSLAIIIGLLQARSSVIAVRNGTQIGVPPSDSLIDFVFLNK